MITALVVPVEGPLRVQSSEASIDVSDLLHSTGKGRYVDFGVKNGDDEVCRLGFLVTEGIDAVNMRARAILADLSGVHMVITGAAVFTGLTDQTIQAMLAGYA